MLLSKLLKSKKTFEKANGDLVIDIISSTFSFNNSEGPVEGFCIVKEEEEMRPDLVAQRIYDNQQLWELLLKYNGISNPLSLKRGKILLAPPYKDLERLIGLPKQIVEKGVERLNNLENQLLSPKTREDQNRIDALKRNVRELVPPNVNTKGNQNVKIKDGRVVFGEDVTEINKKDCPTPISRVRLIQQLTKSNLF
jgi:hypothetical protein